MLAKAPLQEEAIFNQNQAAAEKRRASRKTQHKKCWIAKRDRNDNRNKRKKAGEHGVSVVWTSLGPLPRWVPRQTTRWAPGTTWLVPHGT
jgi:hypothetical protein